MSLHFGQSIFTKRLVNYVRMCVCAFSLWKNKEISATPRNVSHYSWPTIKYMSFLLTLSHSAAFWRSCIAHRISSVLCTEPWFKPSLDSFPCQQLPLTSHLQEFRLHCISNSPCPPLFWIVKLPRFCCMSRTGSQRNHRSQSRFYLQFCSTFPLSSYVFTQLSLPVCNEPFKFGVLQRQQCY